MKKSKLITRKLLAAGAGAASVTFLLCGPIACNLVPPPPCKVGEDPCVKRCSPADGGFVDCITPENDGGSDGGTDGGRTDGGDGG